MGTSTDGERAVRIALWAGGICTGVVALLLAVGLLGRPWSAREALETVAFATLVIVPWALAMGAVRSRSVLLVPAGVVALLLSPLLWSGMLLLLVPGLLYVWAYVRARPAGRASARRLAAFALPPVLTVAAFVALQSKGEMVCVEIENGSSCSTVVPVAGAAGAIALALAAVIAGWAVAAPAAEAHLGEQAGSPVSRG